MDIPKVVNNLRKTPELHQVFKAKLYIFSVYTGFKLTYRDSGNSIHFSIFTMQVFPPSQKITIPKYNAVSYS